MGELANLGLGWLAYRALENWPGVVLIVLALVGLIVLLRKHRDASTFRLSWRRGLDVWAMGIITVCLLCGLWLLIRQEVQSFNAPPPRSWWECLTGD